MRDKERLLDEAEPLRFIFSHSALREGWDNPNVFQICTLREMSTNRERRQTIGRGLRLSVDAHGVRRRDERLNVLTVIADESFEAVADGLQKQIEADLGISFGTVTGDSFAALFYDTPDGTQPMGVQESRALFEHLAGERYLDAAGKIQDSLRTALKEGTLTVPERFDAVAPQARALLTRSADRLDIRNADGVRYQKIGDDVFYAQELFEAEELTGYLSRMVETRKAVHDAIVFDSTTIERPFAEALDVNEAVKVFAKLPSWFKVATPLGSYNPDWAVLVKTEVGERLYFVAETNGTLLMEDLRGAEVARIECGKRHFAAISISGTEPMFTVARTVEDLLSVAHISSDTYPDEWRTQKTLFGEPAGAFVEVARMTSLFRNIKLLHSSAVGGTIALRAPPPPVVVAPRQDALGKQNCDRANDSGMISPAPSPLPAAFRCAHRRHRR